MTEKLLLRMLGLQLQEPFNNLVLAAPHGAAFFEINFINNSQLKKSRK